MYYRMAINRAAKLVFKAGIACCPRVRKRHAAVYAMVPADQLAGFFPGHEDGVARVHMKHAMASGVGGIVLLAAGVWLGRR
jgi:hypothetical protein